MLIHVLIVLLLRRCLDHEDSFWRSARATPEALLRTSGVPMSSILIDCHPVCQLDLSPLGLCPLFLWLQGPRSSTKAAREHWRQRGAPL
jgi:hypothetical protein